MVAARAVTPLVLLILAIPRSFSQPVLLFAANMVSTSTKIGHGLAKVLGIDLHYRNETGSDRITRGESAFSIEGGDSYVEHEPTAGEWLREITPSGQDILNYIIRLFPFLSWIGHYNVQWLIGDLVAGTLTSTSSMQSPIV